MTALLTDEEQDACSPTKEELDVYMGTPDDAVAARIRAKHPLAFPLIARAILWNNKVAQAQLSAVLTLLDSEQVREKITEMCLPNYDRINVCHCVQCLIRAEERADKVISAIKGELAPDIKE